jgi:type IV pilus assembly protein PilO
MILMSIAGWLLLIGPQRSEAAELRDAAAEQHSTNATLQLRLDELVAKSADLPALQARLAAVRSRLPAQAQLPELIRTLTSSASSAGLNLTSFAPSTLELLTAVPNAPAIGAPAVVPEPAAVGAEQLYAINVAMTLTGSYAGVSSYVNQLEELTRAFQVTSFTLAEDTSDGARKGSILLTVQGRVFVLSPSAPDVSTPTTVDPAGTPQPVVGAPTDATPPGTTPSGTTPSGTTPSGTTPSGTAPTVVPSAPAVSY